MHRPTPEGPTMTNKEFRDALKTLGWRQADLARRVGVHYNTISKWARLRGGTEVPGPVVAYLRLALKAKAIAEEI